MGVKEPTAKLQKLGLEVPAIYYPAVNIPMESWAVIACDQFTSESDYWRELSETIDKAPSTLRMVLPECYLGMYDVNTRIRQIHETMIKYQTDGILTDIGKGFVIVQRDTPYNSARTGLLAAIDLEEYDFRNPEGKLIRPSEQTVEDRIPPRKAVRDKALFELPHIMLLLNDPAGLFEKSLKEFETAEHRLYDFDLIKNSGHVDGYFIKRPDEIAKIISAIEQISGDNKNQDFLYAVGDGNHSLATAKAVWEDTKPSLDPMELESHPARFALVEIVNLYNSGMTFEPIHRALFNCNTETLKAFLKDRGAHILPDGEKPQKESHEEFGFLTNTASGNIYLPKNPEDIPSSVMQPLLDEFIESHPEVEIDYIHGREAMDRICAKDNTFGILMPGMRKDQFFDYIQANGPMPRKSFSLGEAEEKRFYIEARKIIP